MTLDDVALLFAVLGSVCVLAAWLGRRSGDAARDASLMALLGAGKLALSAALWLG